MLVMPPVTTAATSGPVRDRGHADGYGGAVAASRPEAAAVAMQVLLDGGRAADAAVAGAAALGVVAPREGGFGGGSALLHADGRTGKVSQVQSCAAGGALAAWEQALRSWGTLSMPEAVAPAAELAKELNGSGERIDAGLVATYQALVTLTGPRQARRPVLSMSDLGRQISQAAGAPVPTAPAGPAVTSSYRGVTVAGGASHLLSRLEPVALHGAAAAQVRSAVAAAVASVGTDNSASVDVLVADRWGDVVTVTSSLGAAGSTQHPVPGRGLWVGRPVGCARSLPSVLVRDGIPAAAVSPGGRGGWGASSVARVVTVISALVDSDATLPDAAARAEGGRELNPAPLALQVFADGRVRAVAGGPDSVTAGAAVASPVR